LIQSPLVDKRFEISNLDLMMDLAEVVDFVEDMKDMD